MVTDKRLILKTLLLTDLHLTHKPEGLLKAQKECILKIFDKERPDEVIIMGDLVMVRRPQPVVLDTLHTIIKTISSHCPLVLLRGNHDSDNRSDDGLTVLSLFESDNVKIITQTTHDYAKQRTYIPHYEDQDRIKNILLTVPEGHSVYGHFGYDGCLNSVGDADFGITLNSFRNCTYLGHIHRFQQSGRVTILGTPYSTNFGESDKVNYYATLEDGKAEFHEVDFGPRYLVVNKEDIPSNLEKINDPNYHTLLRVNLSSGETQPVMDDLNVASLDIKFKPAFDEEVLSDYKPKRDLFTLNEVILEDYIDAAHTDLPKDDILEGLSLIRDEH